MLACSHLKMASNTWCLIFVLVMNFVSLRFGDDVTLTQGVYCDGDPLGLLQQPLFVDYSDLVRVVMVKWNRKSIPVCLLLLCGDVPLNPGPVNYPAKFPCGICTRNVNSNHRSLLCDLCDKWIHIHCARVTPATYHQYQSQPEFAWVCPVCLFEQLPNTVDEDSYLQSGLDHGPSTLDVLRSSPGGIQLIHHNVQGLESKLPEISQWLHVSDVQTILCCSETWLLGVNPSMSITGYETFCSPSLRRESAKRLMLRSPAIIKCLV